MTRYEHLPIYKAAMDLGVYLEGMVHNFGRYHKYTTGQEIRNLAREIIKLIIRANSTQNKSGILSELVTQCEMLKTMLFFAKETRAGQFEIVGCPPGYCSCGRVPAMDCRRDAASSSGAGLQGGLGVGAWDRRQSEETLRGGTGSGSEVERWEYRGWKAASTEEMGW